MSCEDCVRDLIQSYLAAREEKSITEVSRDAIPTEQFMEVLKKKRKKGTLAIEFKALSRFQVDHSCEIALLPENRKRNAYIEVLPYDHCRVILSGTTGASSDYINASFIDAHNKPRAYIATQGPNRCTIEHFWHMIWQENAHTIVMATNVFEHARQQCEKYWHNQHGRYGKIDVWLDDTDILADFNIRTFRIKKNGVDEERIIKQFQFANWSDHDCPNPSSVLEYRRRVKAFAKGKPGPIVVHCSAGAGRTGTFIAIDAMLERATTEGNLDIFNYVLYLRNCRQNTVRNLAQYEFIYEAVAMWLRCGTTVVAASNLNHVINKLSYKDQQSKLTGFEREFKTLQTVVPKLTVGECAGGHRAENRRKSRDIMLQPPERSRPYLITHDSNDSTDYINAVYVDGYRHTNAYIVTQWPLKSTVNDIWRLIYDYNIPTMVVLNEQPNSRSYPRFWPTDRGEEVVYGPLTIELEEELEQDGIVSRTFRIKKPPKYVQQMDDYRKYLESRKNSTHSGDKKVKGTLRYKDIRTHLLEAGELTGSVPICQHLPREATKKPTLVSVQAMNGGAVQEEAVRTVKMFHLQTWPNNQRVPQSATVLMELLGQVEDWQINTCHGRTPTCVVSKNGVSRVGCYCAISIAWDKLKAEGEVDVFRAVSTIKINRPQLVENLVEYTYCYNFMLALLKILHSRQPSIFPDPETSQTNLESAGTDSNMTNVPLPISITPARQYKWWCCLGRGGGHRVGQRYMSPEVCAYTKTPTDDCQVPLRAAVT